MFGQFDIMTYIGLSGDTQFISKLSRMDAAVQTSAKAQSMLLNASLIAGAAAFLGASAAAIQCESAFAGVVKTVDGLSDSQGNLNSAGEALKQQFRELALEIPISVNELMRIGELGGQLGIPTQDLIKFTDTIAKLGVTTNLSTEEAATGIARFINVTQGVVPVGMSVSEQVERIGSTIVGLGNRFAATEQDIVDFSARLSASGAVIGLSQDEILAIGTAMSSLGIHAEMGGSAFSRIFLDMMNQVDTGGAKVAVFAQVTGLSVEKFSKLFKDDASKAIELFIAGLGNTSEIGKTTFQVIDELGYSNIRTMETLLKLSEGSDLFSKALADGAILYEQNNALNEEAAKRFATTESALLALKNVFIDSAIELGNNWLPLLNDIVPFLTKHDEAVRAITFALGGMTIAVGIMVAAWKIHNSEMLAWIGMQIATHIGSISNTVLGLSGQYGLLSGATTILGSTTLATLVSFTVWAGAIVILVAELKLLYDAYNKYMAAKQIEIDATERATAMTEKGTAGFKSMGLAIEELKKHSDTEMVTVNGQIMTVGEASINLGNAFDFARTQGKGMGAEVTLAFEKTAAQMSKNEAAMKGLELAGIQTDAQIKDQIAILEISKNQFGYNERMVAAFDEKIKALKDSLVVMKIPTEAITASIGAMREAMQTATPETKLQAEITEYLKGTLIETDVEMEKIVARQKQMEDASKKVTDNTKENAIAMAGLADQVLGAEGSLGKLVSIGFTFAANPILGAVQLLSFGIDLLSSDTEKVKITTDQYIESLGVLGTRIQEVNKIMESFDAIQSNLLDEATELNMQFIQMATDVENLGGVFQISGQIASDAIARSMGYADLADAIAQTTAELVRLNAAFIFANTFDKGLESLQAINEQTLLMISYYGTTNWDKSGLIDLLTEQLALSDAQLALLDPLSQAYSDLYAQYVLAEYSLARLNGTLYEYLSNLTEEQRQILILNGIFDENTEALARQNALFLDMAETIANLPAEFRESGQAAADAIAQSMGYADLEDAISQTGAALTIATAAQEAATEAAKKQAEQLAIVQKAAQDYGDALSASTSGSGYLANVQAMIDLGIESESSVRDQIASITELALNVKVGSYEYQQLQDQLSSLYESLGETSPYDQQIAAQEKLDAACKTASEQLAILQETAQDYGDALSASTSGSGYLANVQAMIDLGIESESSVRAQIASLEELALNVKVGSYEYGQIIEKINAAYGKLGETSPWITEADEVDTLSSSIISLTINWGAMLDQMFGQYDQFATDMKTATEAIDKLLYFEIDLSTTSADEQINASIQAMRAYLATLSPTSQAYIDAQTALVSLEQKFTDMGGVITQIPPANIAVNTASVTAAQTAVTNMANTVNATNPSLTVNANTAAVTSAQTTAQSVASQINSIVSTMYVQVNWSSVYSAINAIKYAWSYEIPYLNLIVNTTYTSVTSAITVANNLATAINAIPNTKNIYVDPTSMLYAITYANNLKAALLAVPTLITITVKYVTSGTPPTYHTGGELQAYHTGGMLDLPYAHSGLGLGRVGGLKEVPFIGLETEQVINPRVSQMFSASEWGSFQRSGDSDSLGGGRGREMPTIVINEPGPLTSVSFTDNYVNPRQKEQKAYTSKMPDQFRRFR